jgi:hypothetical protein
MGGGRWPGAMPGSGVGHAVLPVHGCDGARIIVGSMYLNRNGNDYFLLVVIAIVVGKSGILASISPELALRAEGIIDVISGGAIVTFGTLFLITTVNIILY